MDSASDFSQTIFGVSRALEETEFDVLKTFLENAWRAQFGRPPSTLSVDLEELSNLYRSHVQAKRVRDAAEDLGTVAGGRPVLPAAIFVPVDESRGFVTPEGRVLLELLERVSDGSIHVVTKDSMLAAYAMIAEFYGGDQRRWMRKEVAGGNVRPASIGFAVFLLINNSISESRALLLPSSQRDEEALARTILPVVSEFSVRIGGSPVKARESERLRSNWIVTETKRQLPRFVSRSDEQSVVRYWIESASEPELVKELGQLIARRRSLDIVMLQDALERSLEAYELARPMLASWDLSHERAGHTREVFSGITDAYLLCMRG